MNSTRPREYDGSHLVFAGMNPEITLREHQKNAIAHVIYGGNTMLAHEVGAGKTFEMVAAAMESKRLGLCSKSIFVVPNHLTDQWASEFLRLYPSANILVTTKKDFEPKARKKFCSRIATGDYDAVIIGHSQFEKIPISKERQQRILEEQIADIEAGIEELSWQRDEKFSIKQLEKTKKSLQARLEKLQADEKKDDVITFEQLGVDRMFVDESDNYKNLFLYTKMRNVAGLSTTDAQKSSDMFAKCRYMDELTGGRGIIFATGTPISNSMTELYTLQRYLQYDRLQELGMSHFDCWASRFGETTTALELAPEGTGYRARTRFAKFFNLPELMTLFKEVADIKTADQLDLPTPKVEYHNHASKPTEIQKEMVKKLSERATEVHKGAVDSSVDNMLKITSDGRKLGLDQRIINPLLPDEEGTKVNQCVQNILQYWRDGEDQKLTQLVFCDLSTPKAKKAKSADKEGAQEASFTIYDDIRKKLIESGMLPEQVAFIHKADTEAKKRDLFAKVRSGQVRVLIGSTAKMGAGTNVQDRLIALHDLDAPWRPRDLTQRKGRIERQGNQNETVHVCRYVTEGTFDAYLWQTLETKQRFISQIMTSKSPVRSCEDVDETALSFAEVKALCAGDPRIKERMDLDVNVSKLKLLKADHQSKQFRLEDQILKFFPQKIEESKGFIRGFEADLKTLAEHPLPKEGFVGMEIRGDKLTDKENAGAALIDAVTDVKSTDAIRKPGAAKQKNTIEEKSYEMYVYKLSGTILPAVGNLRLHEVVDTHLQKVLNDEKYKGRSRSHCDKVKIVMNAMFRQAAKSRLIPFNPAEDLIVTAEEGEGHRSITPYEREIIHQVAKYHRCGLWVLFLLSTGLRPGESAPLQVSDIDFEEKLVRITKAIESGTENIIGPPKSKAGIRCVPLRDDIAKELKSAITGKAKTDFVFPQTDGKTMLTTTAISNNWRSFSRQMDLAMGAETTSHGHIYDPRDVDKKGVPLYPDENGQPRNGHKIADDLVLYCLRHTFCTDLQKAGVPLNIARIIMGHEDIRVTAGIYTHTDSEDVRAAGEKLNTFFSA